MASPSNGIIFERGGGNPNIISPRRMDMSQSPSNNCDISDMNQRPRMGQSPVDIPYEHGGISPMSYNHTAPRSIIGQNKIISPPPGLMPRSFPPPMGIDTSKPPPLFPTQFSNSHYNPSNLPFDPFRPPPSLPTQEKMIGGYPSMHTDHTADGTQSVDHNEMASSPISATNMPSQATQAINIPHSAIPHHLTNDPSLFHGYGNPGSSAPNPGSSPMMSFSPSKIPSHTLNKFSQDESSGVPLQTAWTFWIDRSSNNSTLSEYKAVGYLFVTVLISMN